MRRSGFLWCLAGLLGACAAAGKFRRPKIDWAPRSYVCYRAAEPIVVDGTLDEASWAAAEWTEAFLDIEGDSRPEPRHGTRAKMLWDDTHFYCAAVLDEPHVWAKLTERDSVIFHDNDFEVFLDPDADTHNYYELEINAFGTEWDLLLVKPYRDGGPAIHGWDIAGLKTAVAVNGTLNDPSDTDRGWTVEIAIPFQALDVNRGRPRAGAQWRVNFSRVQWRTTVRGGNYVKEADPRTGKPKREDNWVWSPQGLIAMHYPEMWGIVQFSGIDAGAGTESFVARPVDEARWALREVFYAERAYRSGKNRYTDDWSELGLEIEAPAGYRWPPKIAATEYQFEATLSAKIGRDLRITQDGRVTLIRER